MITFMVGTSHSQRSKSKIKWPSFIVVIALIIAFVCFFVFNMNNNPKFWEATAVNCITMVIAVVVSYGLVQRNSDRRKQKEIVAGLISDLRGIIRRQDMYDLKEKTADEINMRNREISNLLEILHAVEEEYAIEEGVGFVQEKFDEYREFVGDHITDIEYLCNSKKELQRPLSLMDNRLLQIAISLYK